MANKKNARRPLAERAGPTHYEQMPGPDESVPGDAPPTEEVAGYIADMTVQLASMARAAKLDLLAYFLDMAHAECIAAGRQPPIAVDLS